MIQVNLHPHIKKFVQLEFLLSTKCFNASILISKYKNNNTNNHKVVLCIIAFIQFSNNRVVEVECMAISCASLHTSV